MNVGIAIGITAGVGFYAALMFVIIKYATRSSRNLLDTKQDVLTAGLASSGAKLTTTTPGGLYAGSDVAFELDGKQLITNVRYVSRSFVRANLKVKTHPLPWVTVFPEAAVERFGKLIGLAREVQTGDQGFDELAYVDSAEAEETVKRLLDPGVRAAVSTLLRLGFKVQFSPAGVEAFKVLPALRKLEDFAAGEAGRALLALSAVVGHFEGVPLKQPGSPKAVLLTLGVFALSSAAFIGSVALGDGLGTALNGLAALGVVLLAGAVTWSVGLLTLAAVVRGQSNAMRWLIYGAVLSVIGLPAFGGTFALWLNQRLDSAPTTAQQTTIVRKHSSNRYGQSFTVEGWEGVAGRPSIDTCWKHYQQYQVGDTVTLTLHPGAFGLAWAEQL